MNKQCITCDITKPLSEFYYRQDSCSYRSSCKKCLNLQKYKHRQNNIIINKNNVNIDKTQKKTCSVCKIEKTLNDFSVCNGQKSGFYSWCLICSRNKDNNRQKITKKYCDTDIKKCTKCNEYKLLLKNFYKKLGSSDGYSNICNECGKQYRQKNSKIIYQKKKHKLNNNIQYKLSENLRARLRFILGNIKIKKPKTDMLISCSLNFFINHLQKSFYDNISLDNYGTIWQLDHIIPCDWFDLTNTNQLTACTHYTNLQALLINDNCVKSNKLDWIHPKTKYKLTFLRFVFSNFITLPKLIV